MLTKGGLRTLTVGVLLALALTALNLAPARALVTSFHVFAPAAGCVDRPIGFAVNAPSQSPADTYDLTIHFGDFLTGGNAYSNPKQPAGAVIISHTYIAIGTYTWSALADLPNNTSLPDQQGTITIGTCGPTQTEVVTMQEDQQETYNPSTGQVTQPYGVAISIDGFPAFASGTFTTDWGDGTVQSWLFQADSLGEVRYGLTHAYTVSMNNWVAAIEVNGYPTASSDDDPVNT